MQSMLDRNPPPELPYYVSEIFDAMRTLSSERQYIVVGDNVIEGKIPWSRLLLFMDARVDVDEQPFFEELFTYADDCWFNKSIAIRKKAAPKGK